MQVGGPGQVAGVDGGGARFDLGMVPAVADGSGNWSATLPYGIRSWNISMLTYDSETNQTSEFSPIYTTFIPLTIRP